MYNFVDNLYEAIIGDKNEEEEIEKEEIDRGEDDDIDLYKELVPYIKVYTEIILFYINK